MSSFTSAEGTFHLDVRHTGTPFWVVLQSFHYHVGGYPSPNGKVLDVHRGTITDMMSVPFPFDRIVRPTGKGGPAGVLHDKLYQTGEMERKEADLVLMEALVVLKFRPVVARACYVGVRAGGWRAWQKHRRIQAFRTSLGLPYPEIVPLVPLVAHVPE